MAKGAMKHALLLAMVYFSEQLLQSTEAGGGGGGDSLKPGDMLNQSSSTCLYSAKGTYRMCVGEFPAGSGLTYLLIYEQNSSSLVWTANRDEPIVNNSGVLTLDHLGVLKIIRQGGEQPIKLYSPLQPTNNTMATLLETGNLVLQELYPNGSVKRVLWQSFDHPTNVLIPGMKLGVNHRNGHDWSLVSRLTSGVLSSGAFSLEWDPRRGQLMIRRRGQVCWASGVLRNKRFEFISEEAQSIYEYKTFSSEDEAFFSFMTNNHDQSYVEWHLHDNGLLRDNRGHDIARADDCYGYNSDGGCQKWKVPTCRHEGEVFDVVSGNLNQSGTSSFISDRNISLIQSDCKAACWSNCDCVAFESYFDNGTGCSFYHGNSWEAINFDSGGYSFRLQARKSRSHKGTKRWIWISAVIAAALLIICPSILYLAAKMRKNVLEEKKRKRMETAMLDSAASNGSFGIEDDLKNGHDLKVFSYSYVIAATNGFSAENKLGQGGFGPVYKGVLPTGQEVAIKRLSKTSGQGIVEFKNELQLIGELQHMNLVQLHGCCIQEEERMLIYEYMPNKSLDFFLFDFTRSKLLDWKKRFNIIEGISQGLLYLHKYSRLKVIHRDLKASNILLDENMNPKISDFGLARMFMQQESKVNTNRIVGTYGYMAPEYAMEGVFSTKSDIYSFGVLLLEIVSGRRNNSFYNDECTLNLLGQAWKLWNEGACLQLMDPTLNDSFVPDEVQTCIHVGLLCVEEYADDRPTMSDIISMLSNKGVVLNLPRRPAVYHGRRIFEGKTTSKQFDTNSVYEISISQVHSR